MASNRTVPTRIVNKNGVSTTVHKRVENSGDTHRTAIPPVSVSTKTSREKKASELEQLKEMPLSSAYQLHMRMMRNKERVSKKDREAMVADLHEDTLAIIDRTLPEDKIPMYNALIDNCMNKRSIADLNNLAATVEVMLEADDIHQRVFHTYLSGLQMYRLQSDPYYDYSKASEHEQEGVRALLRVTMGLGREYVRPNTYVDGTPRHIIREYEGLYNLCFRRPKDAEKIVHLINSRNLLIDTDQDIAAIEALLDQDAENSLMGGVL